jgi:small conductance mechanosensitive channel
MHFFYRFFPCLLMFLAVMTIPLAAQDAAPAEAEKAQSATTTDPSVEPAHLALLLSPLTRSELGVEAEGWRDLVKETVQKLSEATIASRVSAGEGANKETVELLAKLQDEKGAALERFGIVLSAYEEKGGDSAEYQTYAKAVSGLNLDMNDAGGSFAVLRGWLSSKEGGIKWGIGILKFAAIMVVFWIIARIVSRLVKHATDKHLEWSELLERFINKLVKRAILAVGLLVALSTIGVNVGALLAVIGGGAFVVGFALQDTLGNFAAGLMLLIYRPFDVGDFVEVGGVTGKVDSVSLVTTTIRTPDNKVILVPNRSVWGQVITNATASDERRVDMVFGVGYDDDLAKAQEILERIVAGHDLVLSEPAPLIKVNELADSSVNFVCRPWSKTGDYWDVYWDVTRKVKEEFDANGISIPFPQQDVHMHQVNG